MNVTSWKAKNSKPGIARIHRPWDAVMTVKTAASGSVMSVIGRDTRGASFTPYRA
jgi:hypothetical protein